MFVPEPSQNDRTGNVDVVIDDSVPMNARFFFSGSRVSFVDTGAVQSFGSECSPPAIWPLHVCDAHEADDN